MARVNIPARAMYRADGTDTTYATARSTGTDYSTAQETATVAHDFNTPNYYVARAVLRFDTSVIGAGATVLAVTMTLSAQGDYSTNNDDVQIVKANWRGLTVDVHTDAVFDIVLTAALDAVWRNTNGMALDTPYESPALDPAWVVVDGDTYYGLRMARDQAGTQPSDESGMDFHGPAAVDPTWRPTLNVMYSRASAQHRRPWRLG